ncbi:MAG: glycerophosphodiester phosphodiesterase family protein [Chlorobium sp.]|nr:MAG: glycerophosphodiester phosphodiesterase [Chlorobium sp.]
MCFEIQAHRGARSFFPENTLQAFFKAADLGVRVLELDLVVSKDMEVVVSHDPWLSAPLCSDPQGKPLNTEDWLRYNIYEMSYSDIELFDCGLPHPSFPFQQRIVACKPLLSKVFKTVDAYMVSKGMKGQMIYNLEIKSWPDKDGVYHPTPDCYAELVLRLVEAAGLLGCVRIQSFDYRVVQEAWRLNHHIPYGLLINERKNIERDLHSLGFIPLYVNPHFLIVDRELTEYFHGQDIVMIPWTVNRKEDMLAMNHIGADGIITDFPEIACSLFH